MAIIIKAEKVGTYDGPKYKIIEIEALPTKKLPQKYRGTAPWCNQDQNDRGLYVCTRTGSYYVYPNNLWSKEGFEIVLNDLKKCGDHLHRINQEIKKENENWQGEIEWRI